MGEGFLTINMLTELHGADAHGGMHVIGSGDIDGVDVFSFFVEQLTPVLIEACFWELFPCLHSLSEVHITDSDDFDVLAICDLR